MTGILKQLSTYRDNQSFSVGNVGGLAALCAHIAYSGYDCLWLHHAFNGVAFGGGVATILGGMSVHQSFTDNTETDKNASPTN
jgi:hypothetical protein